MSHARAAALGALGALSALGVLAPRAASGATIVVSSTDAAGEGFNDPTPVAPAGGNGATTRGAARMAALQFAANLWGARLDSPITIEVRAHFDPLTCSSSSAVLGQAGTTTVFRDFPAAPRAGAWYTQALANALARADLDPADPDIDAAFTSAIDGGACLGGHTWYYGFDGQAPGGTLDFVTTAAHELGHGLGFLTYVDLASGAKLLGFDDPYMLNLERHGASPAAYSQMTDAQRVLASESGTQLQWTGPILDGAIGLLTAGTSAGHVLLYGPSTQAPGSSVSHFATTLTPDEIMEPFFTVPDHDLTLTVKLLQDTGWRTLSASVPGLPRVSLLALALALCALGVGMATRGAASPRRLTLRRPLGGARGGVEDPPALRR